MKRSLLLLFLCCFIFAKQVSGQQIFLPLGYQVNAQFQSNSKQFFKTSVYPQVVALNTFDSIYAQGKIDPNSLDGLSWAKRKGTIESVIQLKKDDVILKIDPLFYFQLGKDLADESPRADTTRFYTNTRAARVQGWLGEKFYFLTEFYENQAFYPQYADAFARQMAPQSFANGQYNVDSTSFGLVPGMGRAKNFQKTGWDYGVSNAFISFTPSKTLNIVAGTGKNFIGEGYRTLFLSDNAFNYPFAKLKWEMLKGRITYNFILATFINLQRIPATTSSEAQFKRKDANFHYVEIAVSPKLKLGLFEANIFNRYKDGMGSTPINWALFNPIIYSSTIAAGSATRMASSAGMDLRYALNNKIKFYSQIITGNKFKGFGYQALIEFNNVLKGLNIKAEYSQSNKFLYVGPNAYLNVMHYNQPIAHPLGNQFAEAVFTCNYNLPRFGILQRFNIQNSYVPLGAISSAAVLNDMYAGLDRQNTYTTYSLTEAWFNLTLATHLQVFTSYLYRKSDNSIAQTTNWLMFGIRSNINNQYFDF